MAMRNAAASSVTPENAPDVLMDMAAQCPKSLEAPMDIPNADNPSAFGPERAWNASGGSRDAMAASVREALSTPGNFCWGDATAAALVEMAANVNVILLAVDAGVKMPPTPRELAFARVVFGRWVEATLENGGAGDGSSAESVIATMEAAGLTWPRALALSRADAGFGPGRWLRGRRQPVGTVRELCSSPAEFGNISMRGYSRSRPTVVIWNRSNAHWMPVGVGPASETLVAPESALRLYVDELMK
jgi:hypothetical protein